MKFNWVDLILTIAILGSFIRGYKVGFLESLFSAVGFVAGGLAGLTLVMHLVRDWNSVWGKFGLIFAGILIAATIGENLFRSSAKFFHSKILFGPFRWLDSLAGAAFSTIRTLILIYVISALFLVSPWGWAHENIPKSRIYTQIHHRAPGILAEVENQIRLNFHKLLASK